MTYKKVPIKEAKDGNEQKLKRRVKRLEKENTRLKSELKTLEAAFRKTSLYLKDNTDNFSVEKVIDGVKKDKSLKKIQTEDLLECSKCGDNSIKKHSLPFGSLYICSSCNNRWTVNNE